MSATKYILRQNWFWGSRSVNALALNRGMYSTLNEIVEPGTNGEDQMPTEKADNKICWSVMRQGSHGENYPCIINFALRYHSVFFFSIYCHLGISGV